MLTVNWLTLCFGALFRNLCGIRLLTNMPDLCLCTVTALDSRFRDTDYLMFSQHHHKCDDGLYVLITTGLAHVYVCIRQK